MLPGVSAFSASIPLNAGLWIRLKAVAATVEARALTGIHRRFLDETVADFQQAGADLPAAARTRLEAIQTELAQITQKYSENVLDATNAWQLVVTEEARLAGLPAHAKAAARRCISGAMACIRMAARTVSTALSAGTSRGGGGL
eukprot:gene19630-26828_t